MKLQLDKGKSIAGMIVIGIFVACFNVVAGTFLLKFGWAKVSHILFPGLVVANEAGEKMINDVLSFGEAFYVALFIYFILKAFSTGIATVNKGKDDK